MVVKLYKIDEIFYDGCDRDIDCSLIKKSFGVRTISVPHEPLNSSCSEGSDEENAAVS